MTAIEQWFSDGGDATVKVTYPLTEDSVVFDVGGYTGGWTVEIVRRYNARVFVFEPVAAFVSVCQQQFAGNSKITVLNYGLSDHTHDDAISIRGDASIVTGTGEKIHLRDASEVIREFGPVDLISLNIEGGEYQVLPRLIETGAINQCQYVQVQFHDFIPNAAAMRDAIREKLKVTHEQQYCYPFVWESWKRK